MKGRRRSRTILVGVATAAVSLSSAALVSSPASAGYQRPQFTTGGWIQVSSGNSIDIIENIGLARFGTSLQAVWVTKDTASTQALHTRIISAAGTPTSPDITALAGWATLSEFPQIIANASQRVIAFAGVKDTNSANPYSQGYEYYLTSPDGSTWTLSTGALSQSANTYGSDGTDAVDAGGTPIVAYTNGSAASVSFHSGFLSTIPTTPPGSDPTTTPAAHCCTYDTGLGYDASSNQTWAVWYSNSGDPSTNGVLAQQIEPTLGTQVQAPGSNVVSYGANSAVAPIQRFVTADRVGGGVYAGYLVGYPTATKVALWRLGSASSLVHSAGGSAQAVGAAAAPGGRMWLYWWDGGTHTIDAVRTNPGGTRFGAVCSHPTPNQSTDVWDLVGNASQGPLQLFTLAGSSNPQVYDTVVDPCLSVTLSPASIPAATGGRFTVTVSDAGAPVKGAGVAFQSHHATTNGSGQVSFAVAKNHSKGRFPVTVTDNGYQDASASIRVH